MTQSFEYRRNEFCHKILDALYRHASPVIRENTFGKMMEGIEGTLLSNKYFPTIDITDFSAKFNEPDIFIQDCCEYLANNKHIEPTQKTVTGIFLKIKFTKSGVDAFKTDSYLKENQKQDWATQLRKSTLLNNRLTPLVAGLTLVVSCVTLFIQAKDKKELQVSSQQLQCQLQSIDSSRRVQTNALYLVLKNLQKSPSDIDTFKAKNKTK